MTLKTEQVKILSMYACALLLGVFCALLYDGIRILRKARKSKSKSAKIIDTILTSLEDIIFFVFAGCASAVLFYVYDYGRVRIFVFVLEIVGFILYRCSLSKPIMKVSDLIIGIINKVILRIYERLLLPFVRKIREKIRQKRLVQRKKAKKKQTAKTLAVLVSSSKKGYI